MKRDWDLVRTILLHVEAQPAGQYTSPPACDGFDQATVNEHAKLLIDAGLIEGKVLVTFNGMAVHIRGLTMSGHDFLANAKNETLWHKMKDKVKTTTSSMSFDVVVELLKRLALSQAGL